MVNSSSSSRPAGTSTLDAHLQLLSGSAVAPESSDSATTPIFTEDVRVSRGDAATGGFTQYGLLGGHIGRLSRAPASTPASSDPRIYYNVAAPSSTFICGSQGSGKSHTLSCLLENCLIPSVANVLPRPLFGIVFHHDTFISDTGGSPCEAAHLSSSPSIKVRVVCAPTNNGQIKRIYGHLPSVIIQELHLNQSDLDTKRMLGLMAVSSVQGGGMPLYLHIVVRVLRDLRMRQQKTPGVQFDYGAFKRKLTETNLTKDQMVPLQQRLGTLESFMLDAQASAVVMSQRKQPATNQLGPRQMACLLFNICLGLFLERDSSVGCVTALDEAHKYMTESSEAMPLINSLLSTIRLQRRLGARIIISTQEPQETPRSRFQTQQGDSMAMSFPVSDISAHLFTEINKLQTGEALLFSPTALVGLGSVKKESSVELEFSDSVEEQPKPPASSANSTTEVALETPAGQAIPLANNVLKLRIRARITSDGGCSVMAA
ncbi:hypothetical protein S40288_05468 [Stachybotrys chartarum IBT 40288]|nr:hypothetical protein S40288_05468 [Stachybotrys chartarum IBT 40288]